MVHKQSAATREKLSKLNIGKKLSTQTKIKISNTLKGIKRSELTKNKIRSARIGMKHSDKSKLKMSESHKGFNNPNTGRPRSKHVKDKISKSHVGKLHSEETKRKLSEINSGDKSLKWKGGISFSPYCKRFNERRKRAVRDFFNNLCICTGEPQYHRALSVHHIDHDKDQGCNGKPFNLVPMCDRHHAKEAYNEEEYKQYINKTLREGFKWGIWNKEEYMEKVMY
jgi:hypothetical protein